MCGIFGIISSDKVNRSEINILADHAEQRGKDSSGLIYYKNEKYSVFRADFSVNKLLRKANPYNSSFIVGHSRLITNGVSDNQPVAVEDIFVLHNGIIVNHEEVWSKIGKNPTLEIDTEVIAAITNLGIEKEYTLEKIYFSIKELCQGVMACAIIIPRKGKLMLFSNNGSLYAGYRNSNTYFASESYPLNLLKCNNIVQVIEPLIIDIPLYTPSISVSEIKVRTENLIPALPVQSTEEKILEYKLQPIKRCSRCILPETMPFITFDSDGVCNYCRNYKARNIPRPTEELFDLVEPYRKSNQNECIVPFSGGRDSCYSLHLIVNELKMKPVTYTYDWGMVTDLGRRNISRMCSKLGVENIIVAADITRKRKNIRNNLVAWLKSPHLGMISILTAGDKHFFRYIETIKRQTGIKLNLWGINPLEVTYFKSGFLGIPPDFEEKRVYTHGAIKQLRYQFLRINAMLKSPGYFNSSVWDTLSGEYYRSIKSKQDYFHIFDYWRWDEQIINEILADYEWERAPDTKATWRIGDGTAAFYNYIYYTVAGFTEHDTFRSNQIREGQLTRDEALKLVEDENRPRYRNIKWYLDAIGLDFVDTIQIINNIPKLGDIDR